MPNLDIEVYARIVNVGLVPPLGTTLRDGDVNAQRYLKNGVDLNTAGTLSNVAYKNQANTFTGTPQTAPVVNGSTRLEYAGVDINTNTALSNVPYLNKANTFSTGTQTVQTLNAVTAIQLNGTSIGVNTAYSNIVYIDRANTFTGTTQTAPNFDATTALKLNGANINTGGGTPTLNNVDYLDATQTVSADKTFSGNLTFSGQHRARLRKSSAHSAIATATATTVDFNTADNNVGSLYVSGSTVTIIKAGTYLLQGQISWPANATGLRICYVQVDSATKAYRTVLSVGGAVETVVGAETTIDLAVNAVVRMQGYQDSGGNLTPTNGAGSTWLAITRIA